MSGAFLASSIAAFFFPLPFKERLPALRFALLVILFIRLGILAEESFSVTNGIFCGLFLIVPYKIAFSLLSLSGEILDSVQSSAIGSWHNPAGDSLTVSLFGILFLFLAEISFFKIEVIETVIAMSITASLVATEGGALLAGLLENYIVLVDESIFHFAPLLLFLLFLLWSAASVSRSMRGLSLTAEVSVVRMLIIWGGILLALHIGYLSIQSFSSHTLSLLQAGSMIFTVGL